jgi:RNA ligase (TIGR02306 family)
MSINKILEQTLFFLKNDKLKKNILKGRVRLEKINLANIEIIKKIKPHPTDNLLEVAEVLHWECIIDKNKFKTGEKIVFIVIDSIIPVNRWNEYIQKQISQDNRKFSTIKLRGVYSQGIIMRLDVLPEHVQNWSVGSDVNVFFNIKKYEKEFITELSEDIIGFFPNFLCAHSDEDHGNSNPELVREVLKSEWITVTQKLDGHSCTVIIEDKKIKYVCSKQHILKENPANKFWIAAKKINLNNIDNSMYILQGELMGPGLIKNQLKLTSPEIFIYQIKHNNQFYSYVDMISKCQNIFNCKYVPLVNNFNTYTNNVDMKFLQNIADQQFLPNKLLAEGIVIRPLDYPVAGSGRPLGFKIINRNYIDAI